MQATAPQLVLYWLNCELFSDVHCMKLSPRLQTRSLRYPEKNMCILLDLKYTYKIHKNIKFSVNLCQSSNAQVIDISLVVCLYAEIIHEL